VTLTQRLYLMARRYAERWLDCRPIPARELIAAAGFEITRADRSSIWGLPVDTVVATRR
jgi:hypothetical protein